MSKIIKGDSKATGVSAEVESRKIVKKEIFSASTEAKEIIEEAKAEAQRILEAARNSAQEIEAAAREQGYQEGLQKLTDLLFEFQETRDKLLHESEQELLEVAFRIAKKIIGLEVKQNPGALVGIVREALSTVPRSKELVIRLNPKRAEEVQQRVHELRELLGPHREIEIVPKSDLSEGDCVIESELGIVDARLETQLRCLQEALRSESS